MAIIRISQDTSLSTSTSDSYIIDKGVTLTLDSSQVNVEASIGYLTFSGNISGDGNLVTQGDATFPILLTGNNIYKGTTIVKSGILQAGTSTAFSPFSDFTLMQGSLLNLNSHSNEVGSLSGEGDIILQTATIIVGGNNLDTTFAGNISPYPSFVIGQFTKKGSGTLTLTGTKSSYGGITLIIEGTLKAGAPYAFSPYSEFRIAPLQSTSIVTVDLNNYDQQIRSITDQANMGIRNLQLGSATLTLNGSADTFSGTISGSGKIYLDSTLPLMLLGANTYTGGTEVNSGDLMISASNNYGTGPITIKGSCNLRLLQYTILSNPITIVFGRSLTIDTQGYNLALLGTLRGDPKSTIKLIKKGSGVLGLLQPYIGPVIDIQGGSVVQFTPPSSNIPIHPSSNDIVIIPEGETYIIDTGPNKLTTGISYQEEKSNLEKRGSGLLVLENTNSYSGKTIISEGTIQNGNEFSIPRNSTISLADKAGVTLLLKNFDGAIGGLEGGGTTGGTLSLNPFHNCQALSIGNNNESTIFKGTIQGAQPISKIGSGTLELRASGIQLTSLIAIYQGILAFNTEDGDCDLTIPIICNNSGTLEKRGNHTLKLTALDQFNGCVHVVAGTLQFNLPALGLDLILDNAPGVSFTSSLGQTMRSISGGGLKGGNVTATSLTIGDRDISSQFDGILTVSIEFIKEGTGTFTLTHPQSTLGYNPTINEGTLSLMAPISLNNMGTVTIKTGGVLNLNQYDNAFADLSDGGTSGGQLILGGGTLTLGLTTLVFGGTIAGTGNILLGAQTALFSGNNSLYTGTLTLNYCALTISAPENVNSTKLVIQSPAITGPTLIFTAAMTLRCPILNAYSYTEIIVDTGCYAVTLSDISGTGKLTQQGTGRLILLKHYPGKISGNIDNPPPPNSPPKKPCRR